MSHTPTNQLNLAASRALLDATRKPAVGGGVRSSPATLATKSALAQTNIAPLASKDEAALNKWEREYWALLNAAHGEGKGGWVGVQCLTFKLGDDCRYSPDFVVLDGNGVLWAHEVKGFFRDDAKVKIKVAASKFRWVKFVLATKPRGKNGAWDIREISP